MSQTPFKDLVDSSEHIVVVQADNPDGDSVSSALILEQVLSDLGKKVTMFCGVEIPTYLRHLDGWDRVVIELPKQFDSSIIVDTSAISLLETLEKTRQLAWLKSKPSIILDHHVSEPTIDFAKIIINDQTVSTGELIYNAAKANNWTVSDNSLKLVAFSILSDTLGLTSESVTAKSIRVLADLVESGVSLAELENTRRSTQKKSPELVKYKGALLQRVEYSDDQRIAFIHIPWEEIEKYSHQYNPSMLVLDEMRQVEEVHIAIAFKTYPDGRITAKIRANYGVPIAAELAESFGGGGHVYASGFRITDGRSYNEIKSECIKKTNELLG